MSAWLMGLLSRITTLILESGFKKLMEWVALKFKIDQDNKKIDAEVEAVKKAQEIIDQKKAMGEEPTKEDYERLKNANRRLNSGIF